MSKVLAYTLTYQAVDYKYVKAMIESFQQYAPDVDILIVDESPDPRDAERIKLLTGERVRVERLEEDSRVHANVLGQDRAVAEHYDFGLLVDSDVIVLPNAIQKLVKCARTDSKIAVTSPLINSSWHEANSGVPDRLMDVLDDRIDYGRVLQYYIEHHPEVFSDGIEYKDIYAVDATFMLFNCAITREIGGFDRRLQQSGFAEELAYRLMKNGLKWRVCTTAHVYHCRRGMGACGITPQVYWQDEQVLKSTYGDEETKEIGRRAKESH